MKLEAFAAAAIAAFVLGTPAPSHAQAASGGSDTYGASDTAYVIGAYDFEPDLSTTTFVSTTFGARYSTTGGATFGAPVYLPNGAVITRIELQGCDFSAGSNLGVSLHSSTITGGAESQMNHGVAVTSGTPGCGLFSANVGIPPTVTNQTHAYFLQLGHGGVIDGTIRFLAVRLYYHLQVSPAPATATFPNDVPTTHTFFRWVEALAASGISGGCGAGAFCPDAPVTRGQMAVFMATALGLHFPN